MLHCIDRDRLISPNSLFGGDCLILKGLFLTASVMEIEVRPGNCSSAALLTS